MVTVRPFLSLALAVFGVGAGTIAIYETMTELFPVMGLVPAVLATLGVAAFMIVAGGIEVLTFLRVHLRLGRDSKRCNSCKASVPRVARYCRECGTAF